MHRVIDTNLLLVANGRHRDASPRCVEECVERLQEIMQRGVVVIDDDWRILGEYLHKTHPNQPKGVGDVFLKWLLRACADARRVHRVTLTETDTDFFEEFPVSALQADFDPPDRKFAAVAHAHPEKPPVLQAADCKWLDWWGALSGAGVGVDFLCRTDVKRYYAAKFPDRPLPDFP